MIVELGIFFCNIVVLLLLVAFVTLFERKVFASIQRRKGPEYVGIFGLLQPVADGFKLLFKEPLIPSRSNFFIFIFAPILVLFCSISLWLVIPFSEVIYIFFFKYGMLFGFCFSSLVVYGLLLAGWFSGSRYAGLGAIRSISQLVSYEMCLGLSLFPIFFFVGSFDLFIVMERQWKLWFVSVLPVSFSVFFVASLAELNRTPFDLPEAESELVSGYNVEYGSAGFVLFYIAEYLNMILYSFFITIFFFGGYFGFVDLGYCNFIWLVLKVLFWLFLFIVLRACLPRFRYDQLMFLCWQVLFPIAFGNVFFFCLCLVL